MGCLNPFPRILTVTLLRRTTQQQERGEKEEEIKRKRGEERELDKEVLHIACIISNIKHVTQV